MLQIKGLGSTIRDVVASGTGRVGGTGSSTSAPPSAGQASSPDAARVAAIRRTADAALPFQQSLGESIQGDRSRIERTKSRGPAVRSRGDADASESAQTEAESSVLSSGQSLPAGVGDIGSKGVGALGGKGRATAFQAQRIAQEVIPEAVTATAEAGGSGPVQGITALARRVASHLYDFVRDAVGRSSSQNGIAVQVLVRDGYQGRVDLKA